MGREPYENVKKQVGHCGIWCGSCIVGNGALRELTKRYEGLIKGYGIDDWGAKGFDPQEFMKGLAEIQKIPVCRGCRKGGGNETCKVRICARSRAVSICDECPDVDRCAHKRPRDDVREGALKVGMLATEADVGEKQLAKKGEAEIKGVFPYCVIDVE